MTMISGYSTATRLPSILIVLLAWALAGTDAASAAAPSPRPDMLYATGEGAVPSVKEQPNRARAYLQAKSYAKMQAIASLVQEARGTIISYCSSGRDYIADTRIKEEIKGVLDSVRVVSAKKRPEGKDTIVEVTVTAPKPALPKAPPAPKEPPLPKAQIGPSWLRCSAPGAGDGCYTSVMIDAAGLKVLRSMSPKILRPDGSEVWGTLKVDPEILSDHGIAAYVHSRAEAYGNRRCGERPLIVRAIARGSSITKSDVVISNKDAALLVEEDRRASFLADLRVIIVVDRTEK